MALAQTTNRRIARHRANLAAVKADQSRPRTHPRGGGCRLTPGMPTANHQNIKI
jgi:hypothetical protein